MSVHLPRFWKVFCFLTWILTCSDGFALHKASPFWSKVDEKAVDKYFRRQNNRAVEKEQRNAPAKSKGSVIRKRSLGSSPKKNVHSPQPRSLFRALRNKNMFEIANGCSPRNSKNKGSMPRTIHRVVFSGSFPDINHLPSQGRLPIGLSPHDDVAF